MVLPVPHTATACAGAAAGFLLRRIAYKAGAYAPGIQEALFFELTTPRAGATIDAVAGWLAQHGGSLHAMGYRVSGRRVVGETTETILSWVRAGNGLRGAVLATAYRRLHPAETDAVAHAVGVTVDRLAPRGGDDLVMIDPWPGTKNGARDRGGVPAELEPAHRAAKYAALILYWAGWS